MEEKVDVLFEIVDVVVVNRGKLEVTPGGDSPNSLRNASGFSTCSRTLRANYIIKLVITKREFSPS